MVNHNHNARSKPSIQDLTYIISPCDQCTAAVVLFFVGREYCCVTSDINLFNNNDILNLLNHPRNEVYC